MADVIDVTADREEREAPMRIAASRRPEGPAATGVCLDPGCAAPLIEAGRRWCDGDCRDMWAKTQRSK